MKRLAALLLVLPLAPVAAQSIKPGQWQITVTVTNLQMPGAPPQVLAMMKKPQSLTHCVTPQEAAAGPQAMFKAGPSCKVARFAAAGGKIDGAMSCTDPRGGGGSMQTTISGIYSPTSFATSRHMVVTSPSGSKMITDAKGDGHWTGACGK